MKTHKDTHHLLIYLPADRREGILLLLLLLQERRVHVCAAGKLLVHVITVLVIVVCSCWIVSSGEKLWDVTLRRGREQTRARFIFTSQQCFLSVFWFLWVDSVDSNCSTTARSYSVSYRYTSRSFSILVSDNSIRKCSTFHIELHWTFTTWRLLAACPPSNTETSWYWLDQIWPLALYTTIIVHWNVFLKTF